MDRALCENVQEIQLAKDELPSTRSLNFRIQADKLPPLLASLSSIVRLRRWRLWQPPKVEVLLLIIGWWWDKAVTSSPVTQQTRINGLKFQ